MANRLVGLGGPKILTADSVGYYCYGLIAVALGYPNCFECRRFASHDLSQYPAKNH